MMVFVFLYFPPYNIRLYENVYGVSRESFAITIGCFREGSGNDVTTRHVVKLSRGKFPKVPLAAM